MSTAIAERETALVVMTPEAVTAKAFGVDDVEITSKASVYQSLTVNGVADKAGLKVVREARLELVRVRCDIERRRREIKEGAVVFGRAVDAEAKRLTALVEPTELALKAIEEDIAKEEQREKDKRTAERMKLLSAVDSRYPQVVVAAMPDKDFGKLLAELTADHESRKEAARLKAEQEAVELAVRNKREAQEAEQRRQAEAELAAEREALRKQREAQEAEQRRLDKIRAEQEAAERAQRQAEEDERSRKAEAERKAREDQERADKEAADAARREAMQPDYDKLMGVAGALRKLKLPTVSEAASVARCRIRLLIEEAATEVEAIAAMECGVKYEE